jgi:hypothetical protein
MGKKQARQRTLVFSHDGRPQTMTRHEGLQKSLLFLQKCPDVEVLEVHSDAKSDRITMRHRPTGEQVTYIAYFEPLGAAVVVVESRG